MLAFAAAVLFHGGRVFGRRCAAMGLRMWDYIVRGTLNLPRQEPSWLDFPQMMRVTITTHNVLQMLGQWEIARPYNFLFLPMVDPTFGYAFDREPNEKVLLVCPFSSKQEKWFELQCI